MSDKQSITSATMGEAPLFETQPNQLEPFRGTGYELIPLSGKAPVGKGWLTETALSVDDAQARLSEGRGNVGVRLRHCDIVIDADPRHYEGADRLRQLQRELGIDLQGYPTVVSGAGGYHVYMRLPDDIEPSALHGKVPGYPGLDVKKAGGQVVAPGSAHPETERAYLWDPLEDAPNLRTVCEVPTVLLDLLRKPKGTSSAEPGAVTPEQLAEMLEGLPVEAYNGDHDRWLELMMACHFATGGTGLDEFLAWSMGDAEYAKDRALVVRRWASLHADRAGNRVTERTLFKHMLDAGREDLIPRADAAEDFPDDLGDFPAVIQGEPKDTLLDKINAGRFTVLTGGKYLVGRERFDERMQRHVVDWSPDEAARKHMNIKSVPKADGKLEGLGDWWLKHPKRRQYDWVVFDPSPTPTPQEVYNLWRGWAVQPKPGDWSMLKRLVRDVLCRGDEASYDYVMRWAAFMVQHPNTPAEVALVFKGAKGVGKGTFGRELKALTGQHGRQVAQPEHFTGRFNEHLADTILLFVDEGLWAGDKKVEGALKNLITEPTLTFEGKNKPIIEGPNHLHVVIASNEDWVIPATPDERRFAVFDADTDARAKLPSDFFADLNEQMRSGGRAGMLHDLLAMDLGGWHPRKDIPQTEALAAQKVEGFRTDPIAFWWHRCLENGKIDYLDGPGLWPEPFEADSTAKDAMVDAVNAQARAMGRRGEFTKHKLAQFLGKVGVDVRARNRKGGKVYAVPALNDARKAFEAWVCAPLDWAE